MKPCSFLASLSDPLPFWNFSPAPPLFLSPIFFPTDHIQPLLSLSLCFWPSASTPTLGFSIPRFLPSPTWVSPLWRAYPLTASLLTVF